MCLPFVPSYIFYQSLFVACLLQARSEVFFGSRLFVSPILLLGWLGWGFLLLCVCSPRYLSLYHHLCLHSTRNCYLPLGAFVTHDNKRTFYVGAFCLESTLV